LNLAGAKIDEWATGRQINLNIKRNTPAFGEKIFWTIAAKQYLFRYLKQKFKQMKHFTFLLSVTLLFLHTVVAQSYYSDKVQKIWETQPVFKVPESAIYDIPNDIIYVSNINGDPTEKNSEGFISKLAIDGKVVELRWITGLNAPKGMGLLADTLYVADVTQVVKIDTRLGEILSRTDMPEAEFLNDIIIDDQGKVYISDTGNGAVYFLENGKADFLLPKGTFERPNGLNWMEGLLYVGTKTFIKSVEPESLRIKVEINTPGGVDGLEIYKKKYFIFSDWLGKVQMADFAGDAVILFNTTAESINAADIKLMGKSSLLLVPTFFDNKVMAYQILE